MDAELLDFSMDLWEDIESETTLSSDEVSEMTQSPVSAVASPDAAPVKPKKKKNRGRRKEEIAELRCQVVSLQEKLQSLKLDSEARSYTTRNIAAWENRAKRELGARRSAEKQNQQLHVTLARQIKITQRLVRLISRTSGQMPMDSRSRASSSSGSDTSEDVEISCEVTDEPASNTIVIDMHATWTFLNETAASIAAALWTRYLMTRVNLSQFVVDYEHVSSDDKYIQSFFSITSQGQVAFEGTQLVQKTHNELTGIIEIYEMGQTLERKDGVDPVLDVTMFKDERWWRLSPMDSMGVTTATAHRKFQIKTARANPLHRRAVADAAAIHFKEEFELMQKEVKSLLRKKEAQLLALHTPPRDADSRVSGPDELEDLFAAFQPTSALMF